MILNNIIVILLKWASTQPSPNNRQLKSVTNKIVTTIYGCSSTTKRRPVPRRYIQSSLKGTRYSLVPIRKYRVARNRKNGYSTVII
jgi:hypothetical protein